jgi:hypothetical protein
MDATHSQTPLDTCPQYSVNRNTHAMVGFASRTSLIMGSYGRSTKRNIQAMGGYPLVYVFLQMDIPQFFYWAGKGDACVKDGDDYLICFHKNKVHPFNPPQPD